MLGISDHSYFIRLFRKVTGVTPQDYRRQLRACRHKGLAPVSRRNKEFGLATANPKERD